MVVDIVKTFLLSMLPIGELRASLPVALAAYHLPLPAAYLAAVAGNIVPVVVLLCSLDAIVNYFSAKFSFCKRFFEKLFEKTGKRHSKEFELFKAFALFVITAMPLPVVGGAWTATLAAFVLRIPPRKAIPLISLGIAVAGIIVAFFTYGVERIF